MSTTRTPPRKHSDSSAPAERLAPVQSKVRTSIGEWESGRISPSLTAPVTRPKTGPPSQGSKPIEGRRSSTEASVSVAPVSVRPTRVAEARACLNKAKLNLANSRNIKTEIKDSVIAALDRLYQLVKEAEAESAKEGRQSQPTMKDKEEERPCVPIQAPQQPAMPEQFMKKLDEHSRMLQENSAQMAELKEKLESHRSSLEVTTYAGVVARTCERKPPQHTALHSVAVTSKTENDTGEVIMEKIRKTVNAKEGGVFIDRIRKGKDRKVIIGCKSQEEMKKVRARIEKGKELHVEEMKNKDPLIILYGVLQKNSDEDIIKAIRVQNTDLMQGIKEEEDKIEVRYRKKTRNPLTSHVVCRVSPTIWQKLTAAGSVRIDLQRVGVADQSPLVQCSRCLGYGHGRRFCHDAADVCSHCGGQHRRADCAHWLSDGTPSCVNCVKIKADKDNHNAFSSECPVRRKWEALARSTVAYC